MVEPIHTTGKITKQLSPLIEVPLTPTHIIILNEGLSHLRDESLSLAPAFLEVERLFGALVKSIREGK